MAKPVADPDRPRCPLCGEDVLVERDTIGRWYVCLVCAHTWRNDG
jgi:ribosomal protein L37AE/L43A